MLPSVSHNVDVLVQAGPWIQAGGSNVIVLIEAGGFYLRKYGKFDFTANLTGTRNQPEEVVKWQCLLTIEIS